MYIKRLANIQTHCCEHMEQIVEALLDPKLKHSGKVVKVNWSYGEARDQGKFLLRYKSFSCHNHGEYLSHSRNIFVGERIRKIAFLLLHTFVLASSARLLGKYIGIADHRSPERGRLGG